MRGTKPYTAAYTGPLALDAFPERSRDVALQLAAHVGVAVANAVTYTEAARLWRTCRRG